MYVGVQGAKFHAKVEDGSPHMESEDPQGLVQDGGAPGAGSQQVRLEKRADLQVDGLGEVEAGDGLRSVLPARGAEAVGRHAHPGWTPMRKPPARPGQEASTGEEPPLRPAGSPGVCTPLWTRTPLSDTSRVSADSGRSTNPAKLVGRLPGGGWGWRASPHETLRVAAAWAPQSPLTRLSPGGAGPDLGAG